MKLQSRIRRARRSERRDRDKPTAASWAEMEPWDGPGERDAERGPGQAPRTAASLAEDSPWRDPPPGPRGGNGGRDNARPRYEAPPADTSEFETVPRPSPAEDGRQDGERHFTTPMDTGRFQALMRARARLGQPEPRGRRRRRRKEATTPPPMPTPPELKAPSELEPPPPLAEPPQPEEPDTAEQPWLEESWVESPSQPDEPPTGSTEVRPRPPTPPQPTTPPRGTTPPEGTPPPDTTVAQRV